MTQDRTSRAARFSILALLVGVFAFKVWKISLESSVWQDEVFCLQVAQRSLSGVVDAMREDFHPPLYPILLKAWLAALGRLGIAPTLTAARALNLLVWVLLAWWLASVARRTLGASPLALLLPVLVAGSAHVVQFTSDARSYGLAVAAVTSAAVMILEDLIAANGGELANGSARLRRWASITVLGSIAAWSHLLSLPLLLGVAVTWVSVSATVFGWRRSWSRSFLPIVASILFLASIAPWILPATMQIAAYRSASPAWMTPTTGANLFRVLAEWLPFGRNGFEAAGMAAFSSVLSWLLAVTFMGVGWLAISGSRRAASTRSTGSPSSLVHLVGAGFVLVGWGHAALLWLLQRLDFARMFYGPRYPCLGASLVALGAACWLASSNSRLWTGSARFAAGLWLLASMIGHLSGARADQVGGVPRFVRQARAEAQLLRDAVAGHFPESIGAALPKSSRESALRSSSEALCDLAAGRPVLLVSLSPWRQIMDPNDLLLDTAIRRGLLASETTRVGAAASTDLAGWRLVGATELAHRWCREGVSVPKWFSSEEGTWLSAAELKPEDGWSFLDFDDQLRPARWSKSRVATLRIESNSAVPPGSTLLISGFAAGLGESPLVVVDGRASQSVEKGGVFVLCIPLAAAAHSTVAVEVRSGLWCPDEKYHNGDQRRLGVLIREVGVIRDNTACRALAGI